MQLDIAATRGHKSCSCTCGICVIVPTGVLRSFASQVRLSHTGAGMQSYIAGVTGCTAAQRTSKAMLHCGIGAVIALRACALLFSVLTRLECNAACVHASSLAQPCCWGDAADNMFAEDGDVAALAGSSGEEEKPEAAAGGGPGGKSKRPPKPQPDGQKGVRHQARPGNNKRYCRLCKGWQSNDMFSNNQAVDMNCKKVRDNLYKMAQRQKLVPWFKDIEADDDKMYSLVQSYQYKCPAAAPPDAASSTGSKARARFNLAQYHEIYEASTECIKDDVGEMMCE